MTDDLGLDPSAVAKLKQAIANANKSAVNFAAAQMDFSDSVALTNFTPGKGAKYVYESINVDWDPKDHPRDPHTGEFMKAPSGYIFGEAKTATYKSLHGANVSVKLAPGDVAFQTPAKNIVISHADGTFSLKKLTTGQTVDVPNTTPMAQKVVDGTYVKVGENPGTKIPAHNLSVAKQLIENPSSGAPENVIHLDEKPAIELVQATDADMKVGTTVYKSKAAGATTWEIAAVGPGHSGGIGVSLKKPGSTGGTTNAQYISQHLYVAKPVAKAAPAPVASANNGLPLKAGKSTHTAKQYAEHQAAQANNVLALDKSGHTILSGSWVDIDGKPYLVHASPLGAPNVSVYRWVTTKQQASNLVKEDLFSLNDLKNATSIPDPTGKPYLGANVEAPKPMTDAAPKHGALMSQAAVVDIPNTSTFHKNFVKEHVGEMLSVKDADNITPASGDWLEIEGKPVQVFKSPNEGHVAVAKWVGTKKQASSNTYDFPASVVKSGFLIENPTGKDYTPLPEHAKVLPETSTPEPVTAKIAEHPAGIKVTLDGETWTKDPDGTWSSDSGEIVGGGWKQYLADAFEGADPDPEPETPVIEGHPVGTIVKHTYGDGSSSVFQKQDNGQWKNVDSDHVTPLNSGLHTVLEKDTPIAESDPNETLADWEKELLGYAQDDPEPPPAEPEQPSEDDTVKSLEWLNANAKVGDTLTEISTVENALKGAGKIGQTLTKQSNGTWKNTKGKVWMLEDLGNLSPDNKSWNYHYKAADAPQTPAEIMASADTQPNVFVHPVSGATFQLSTGDVVYKHKKTDNAYIIKTTDEATPINFFTQYGVAQKPKASQKNLDTAYAATDEWPGKVDGEYDGDPAAPSTSGPVPATNQLIENAVPGDKLHLISSYFNTTYTKTADGTWDFGSGHTATSHLTLMEKEDWAAASMFIPAVGLANVDNTADVDQPAPVEALGGEDLEPKIKPKKSKAGLPLPHKWTFGSGKVLDLAVGDSFVLLPSGEMAHFQASKTSPTEFYTAEGYVGNTDWTIYNKTGTQGKSLAKKEGWTVLADYPLPSAKTDLSSYPTHDFGGEETTQTVNAYVNQMKSAFPIETYSSGGISYYNTYPQYDDKNFYDLTNDQHIELVAGYEQIAGSAAATLDKVSLPDLTTAQKSKMTKTKNGFALIARAGVFAKEVSNPETTWSDSDFTAELGYLKEKFSKPAISLGPVLKNQYPADTFSGILQKANTQRQFKSSLGNLGFDPYNGTVEDYDAYAKTKGVSVLSVLTHDQQKQWVLGDLGDPTISVYTKNALNAEIGKAKTKIAVAQMLAGLPKESSPQNPGGSPLPSTLGVAYKGMLKSSYKSDQYDITNAGPDAWNVTPSSSGDSFVTNDAILTAIINGWLSDGANFTESDTYAYGSLTGPEAQESFAQKTFNSAFDDIDWDSPETDATLKKLGARYVDSMEYLKKKRWALYYAMGDEIGKYNLEKGSITSGVPHKDATTHPGSPESPWGKVAYKALALQVKQTPWGEAYFAGDYVPASSMSKYGPTVAYNDTDVSKGAWKLNHPAADLALYASGGYGAAGETPVATKPNDVSDDVWNLVQGVTADTDLVPLIGTSAIDADEVLKSSPLSLALPTLPPHLKTMAAWSLSGNSSADPTRVEFFKAIQAKADAGEFLTENTPVWIAPNGKKYPISPGAQVWNDSIGVNNFFISGPPNAQGKINSGYIFQQSYGGAGYAPQVAQDYTVSQFASAGTSHGDYKLLFTVPNEATKEQVGSLLKEKFSETAWDLVQGMEGSATTSISSKKTGALLTADLKNSSVLPDYPNLYAQSKVLPDHVRQFVLGVLTTSTLDPASKDAVLSIMEVKAKKGHYASMGSKGLFDASKSWVPYLGAGKLSEEAVNTSWSAQAKADYAAAFGIDQGQISAHLNSMLNPEAVAISSGLPAWADLELTPTGKSLGGMHSKTHLVDQDGNEWMQKTFGSDPNAKARIEAEVGGIDIGLLYNFRSPIANAQKVNGKFSYLQYLKPGPSDFVGKTATDLTDKQLQQAMEEHVLDWIISNHDTHSGNLRFDTSGNVFGIDKGQAFKHFPNDKLAVDYLPSGNFEPVWYDQFYHAVQNGSVSKETADAVTKHVLRRAFKISRDRDDEYRKLLEFSLQSRDFWPSEYPTREQFIDALVERKHDTFDSFVDLYKGVYAKSPYDWDIDTENLVPPMLDDHTHIQVSPQLAEDVFKAGIYGKALFFATSDLEDSHILFSKVIGPDGKPMLSGEAKVRKDADLILTNWLKSQTVESKVSHQTYSYTPPPPPEPDHTELPGNAQWFNAIKQGGITVSSHNKAGDTTYNASTLATMEATKQQMQDMLEIVGDGEWGSGKYPSHNVGASTGLGPVEAKIQTQEQLDAYKGMLNDYLKMIAQVESIKGTSEKIQPHFQQTQYSPSQAALDEVKAKKASKGKPSTETVDGPSVYATIKDAPVGTTVGKILSNTAAPTGTIYVKQDDGKWHPNSGKIAHDASAFEGLTGKWAVTKPAPPAAVPVNMTSEEAIEKAKSGEVEPGDAFEVLSSNGTSQWVYNGSGWVDPGDGQTENVSWMINHAGNGGFKHTESIHFIPVNQPEPEPESDNPEDPDAKSTEVKVGSKLLKVTYRNSATHAGTLDYATGDLKLKNGETSEFDFGNMYEIDFGNTVIEYRPWEGAGVAKAQQGLLRFRKKDWDDSDSESFNEVLDVLRQVGLDLDPADETSMELFYWRHLSNILRDREEAKQVKYKKLLDTIDAALTEKPAMSNDEELSVIRNAWRPIMGDKVDSADWHPHYDRNTVTQEQTKEGFTSGKPYWLRNDYDYAEVAKAADYSVPMSWSHDYGDSLKVAKSGAALSSEERYRVLASGWSSGMSSASDALHHGSSAVVYTRQNKGWGEGATFVYHPSVLFRTSNYAFKGDAYGEIDNKKNSPFGLTKLVKTSGESNELMIKNSMSVLDSIAFIRFNNEDQRQEAIKFYQNLGITEIHGLPLNEVFVTNFNGASAKVKKMWEDLIKEHSNV